MITFEFGESLARSFIRLSPMWTGPLGQSQFSCLAADGAWSCALRVCGSASLNSISFGAIADPRRSSARSRSVQAVVVAAVVAGF